MVFRSLRNCFGYRPVALGSYRSINRLTIACFFVFDAPLNCMFVLEPVHSVVDSLPEKVKLLLALWVSPHPFFHAFSIDSIMFN